MFPYFVLLVLAVSLAWMSQISQRRAALAKVDIVSAQPSPAPWLVPPARTHALNPFDVGLICALTLFAGLRSGVGTDFAVYTTLFERLDPQDWLGSLAASPLEPGYTVLSLLVASLTHSPTVLFVVTSLLSVAPVVLVLRARTSHLAVAVFLYITLAYYLAPLNTGRQGVAMGIFLLADQQFAKRKWLFALLVLVAASFHASVLVVAVLYLLSRVVRPTFLLLAVVVTLGVALASVAIPSEVGDIVGDFNERYAPYFSNTPAGLGTYLTIAGKLLLTVYLIWLGRGNRSQGYYRTMVVFSIFFLVAGTSFPVLARLELFSSVFLILALPELLSTRRVPAPLAAALGVGCLVYFTLYLQNYGGLVPYRSVF